MQLWDLCKGAYQCILPTKTALNKTLYRRRRRRSDGGGSAQVVYAQCTEPPAAMHEPEWAALPPLRTCRWEWETDLYAGEYVSTAQGGSASATVTHIPLSTTKNESE